MLFIIHYCHVRTNKPSCTGFLEPVMHLLCDIHMSAERDAHE